MRCFMYSLFKTEAGQYWHIGDFTADFQSLESHIQAVVMRCFMYSLFKTEAGQYWHIGDFTADFQSLESHIQAVVIFAR